MNQAPSPFQPSRFATLRTTTPVPVSWETIISELTGPHHEGPTRLYRQTIADFIGYSIKVSLSSFTSFTEYSFLIVNQYDLPTSKISIRPSLLSGVGPPSSL